MKKQAAIALSLISSMCFGMQQGPMPKGSFYPKGNVHYKQELQEKRWLQKNFARLAVITEECQKDDLSMQEQKECKNLSLHVAPHIKIQQVQRRFDFD